MERSGGDPLHQYPDAMHPGSRSREAKQSVGTTYAGKFCGVAGCLPVEGETFGLFYQLLPSYWGQGVGRAAAEMVLEALRRLSPSATVCADVVAENTASIRILEGLGFRRVRTSAPDGGCGRLAIWEYQRSFGNQAEECL